MIHALYIFDRHCACVYLHSWPPLSVRPGHDTLPAVHPLFDSDADSPPPPPPPPPPPSSLPFDEHAKLVYGALFSLRVLIRALARTSKDPDTVFVYRTDAYALHYFAPPSSFHFVLITDKHTDDMLPALRHIYAHSFLDHVVRNPLVSLDSAVSRAGIENAAFRASVDSYITGLDAFA